MSFFASYFPDLDLGKTESLVCCPFPHKTGEIEYTETNPSASVNTNKKLFYCHSCGASHSENSFIKEVLGMEYKKASQLAKVLDNLMEDEFTWTLRESTARHGEFGISDEVMNQLQIKRDDHDNLLFPVFIHGALADIRRYRPNKQPKVISEEGTLAGLVMPYDIWRESNKKWTWICAGEKDMAVARSNNLNAICLTGGEMKLPAMWEQFKDKHIAIVYDNDEAGLNGAKRLASFLLDYVAEVRVVTGFHDILEEKEDITDFFTVRGGTREQLIEALQQAPAFTKSDAEETDKTAAYPRVSLRESHQPIYLNKMLRSSIQVSTTGSQMWYLPESVNIRSDQVDKTWTLDESTIHNVIALAEKGEKKLKKEFIDLLGIIAKPDAIRYTELSRTNLYRSKVTDFSEYEDVTAEQPVEIDAYSIGFNMVSGKKYDIEFMPVRDPDTGQQHIIISKAFSAEDSVGSFKITEKTKEELQEFENIPGSVSEKVETILSKVDGMFGYEAPRQLVKAIDFSYHTVLEFDFGNWGRQRGYLDTIIVGESRSGKSSTAKKLQEVYQLGKFASLAGNSASRVGLIGGSVAVGNGNHYQIKAGLIPRAHKGLIILEELAKCSSNIITELTDIRSSNRVRISRASGDVSLPAFTRMITLSNVKTRDGEAAKQISAYPNGIKILQDLVGAPEDIARYDIAAVLPGKPVKDIDPFAEYDEPFDASIYQTRIRWIWSRTPEQVSIDKDVARYIVKECKILNKRFDGHIKIFGVEAWKKVTRLAIAVAGYVVSTDDTYENIIVKREHVDYAIEYLQSLYDNDTFKLAEVVAKEKKELVVTDEQVAVLQDKYIHAPDLLKALDEGIEDVNELMYISGLEDKKDLHAILTVLNRVHFIHTNRYKVHVTPKFRDAMRRIDKRTQVRKVGEASVEDQVVFKGHKNYDRY